MFNQIPYSLQSSVPDALRFYLLIKQTYLTLPPVMKVGVSPAKKDRKEGRKENTERVGKAVTFKDFPIFKFAKSITNSILWAL